MTTITRESVEIKSFITGFLSDSAHDNQSSNSLLANVFRIALASLEAEPVAYQYRQWDAEYDEWGEWEDCGECVYEGFVEEEKCQGAGVQTRKIYAAPPISVTPDGWISCSERTSGKQVIELTMLVKQLVSQLKKSKPDCKLPDKAMGYLERNGLIGDDLA